jgi:hypothetical protein
MSIDNLLERMLSERNRRRPTVKDAIFAIGLIALTLISLYYLIEIPKDIEVSDYNRLVTFRNILCVTGNIVILIAIYISLAFQNDIIYKIIKICCFILIVEAVFSVMNNVGMERYRFNFYLNLFAIPFYILILFLYRKGH